MVSVINSALFVGFSSCLEWLQHIMCIFSPGPVLELLYNIAFSSACIVSSSHNKLLEEQRLDRKGYCKTLIFLR